MRAYSERKGANNFERALAHSTHARLAICAHPGRLARPHLNGDARVSQSPSTGEDTHCKNKLKSNAFEDCTNRTSMLCTDAGPFLFPMYGNVLPNTRFPQIWQDQW